MGGGDLGLQGGGDLVHENLRRDQSCRITAEGVVAAVLVGGRGGLVGGNRWAVISG